MESVPASQEEGASRGAQGSFRFKQGEKVGNRFVIDERLREDVVGSTYRAVDERTGRKIALLMLNPNVAVETAATERLLASIKAASAISHKNVVSIFGMGKESKGKPRYIAQEWIDGANLVQLFEEKAQLGKHFSLHGAYNVIAHLCNVLDSVSMHHGTLRPSVVLLTREGRVKIADFGMGELRKDLVSRRASLSVWDAPCLPANALPTNEITARDDIYALGVILYCLLTGKPFPPEISQAYADIARMFSPDLGDVLRRILDDAHPNAFMAPKPVKRALSEALESCSGAVMKGAAQDVQLSISSTIESADTQLTLPVVPASFPIPSQPNPPSLKAKTPFMMPELKPKALDGDQERWQVTRDGVDFGPYKTEEILRQLMDDRISPESMLFDILTERRKMLSEFPEFDEFLADALLEKADRTQKKEEAHAKAVSRRRTRIFWIGLLTAIVLLVGTVGSYVVYQALQPKPEKARLSSLVEILPASLPSISLAEELPETAAELLEKQQKAKQEAVQRQLAAEARQLAREDRLVAQSEARGMHMGSGKPFDRAAFDRILASKNNALGNCLTAEARRNPSKKSYTVSLTIIPAGTLLKVQLDGSAQGNRCVRQALSGLKVPPFDGSNYSVTLPFNMQ